MMHWCRVVLLLVASGCSWLAPAGADEAVETRVLVIVLDGLRPDYVKPDLMPNLYDLGQRGIVGEAHHAVYPTVTRVNASSIATGCYPAKHGILGNTIYVPELYADKTISTSDASELMKLDEVTGGKLLTVPSLGEILADNGKKLLVVSAGSTGSALLSNHKVPNGALINTDLTIPASLQPRVDELLGPKPEEGYPNDAVNRRAVDAYFKIGLDELKPDVTIMWLSDPDHTAHAKGIGDPVTVECLKKVDIEIGRIVDEHRARGLDKRVNILVTSDHGFSTHKGKHDLNQLLVAQKLKKSIASTDVMIAGGAIHVTNHAEETIRAIVELLLQQDWIGAVFTKAAEPGSERGWIQGTASFDAIHWNHERAGDILVDVAWTDETNDYGWPGTTQQNGTAGHGTASPYDVHNTLIACGPAFRSGTTDPVPTGNVDIAPTVLHLVGISPLPSMDGRVMSELFKDGPEPAYDDSEGKPFDVKPVEPPELANISGEALKATGYSQTELSKIRVNSTEYVNYARRNFALIP